MNGRCVPGPLNLIWYRSAELCWWPGRGRVGCKPLANPAHPSAPAASLASSMWPSSLQTPISLRLIREMLNHSRSGAWLASCSINCGYFSPHAFSYEFISSSGSWRRGCPGEICGVNMEVVGGGRNEGGYSRIVIFHSKRLHCWTVLDSGSRANNEAERDWFPLPNSLAVILSSLNWNGTLGSLGRCCRLKWYKCFRENAWFINLFFWGA